MINGFPGNDGAVFIDGPTLIINGNIQDGTANTMNSGLIIAHGSAGDTWGYGMRGGAAQWRYCAAGMHEGIIYIRGEANSHLIKGGTVYKPDDNDFKLLDKYITNYKTIIIERYHRSSLMIL